MPDRNTDRPISAPIDVEAICRRALAAQAHLYRLLACDEPDLAANVTYAVGRAKLRRLAATASQSVAGPSVDALLELLEAAERVTDPLLAERLFPTFVDEVIARLEGRLARRVGPSRELGTAWTAFSRWDDVAGPAEEALDRTIERRTPVPR